ncbi:1-deoxy-D-xylulose-5-phosphate reductoisomerase [Desulfopila sp. IMCC35008]|uniref:1-deoxy-D-xylulose-5-phosphate reductoisomerase n=1 Tax=Desulfopila sp. IMCC35008 TaxID=2653858 RepID=UPI0013D6C10D|nr:1-deoxy-D-xylulose-5-phosphate reductoisomerase [Desulfopila sp. IMCC35008]
MNRISLLGSTGSIGRNVLEVVRQFPDLYDIAGLAAGKNIEVLRAQVEEFAPELVSVADEAGAAELREMLPASYRDRVVTGTNGNCSVASLASADVTVSSIVGGAGLLPTLEAIRSGKTIGLANKETLVMAGKIVMKEAQEHGVNVLPIDSEHSAIFQALEAGRKEDVVKIILTASGGPFRGKTKEQLREVTREQALNHPNWDMGQKITIDSATLMNKGLEVIEARWLFGMSVENIDVVVHPQSVVHSLVEYQDGSVMAQLGIPDMRIPIAYALSYPRRLPLALKPLKLSQCSNLEFYEPDYDCFPALGLAFEAIRSGGVAPAVLNGANEVAVAAFLGEKIPFHRISEIVEETMDQVQDGRDDSLDDILAADGKARRIADSLV